MPKKKFQSNLKTYFSKKFINYFSENLKTYISQNLHNRFQTKSQQKIFSEISKTYFGQKSHRHLMSIGGAASSPPATVRHHRAVADHNRRWRSQKSSKMKIIGIMKIRLAHNVWQKVLSWGWWYFDPTICHMWVAAQEEGHSIGPHNPPAQRDHDQGGRQTPDGKRKKVQ